MKELAVFTQAAESQLDMAPTRDYRAAGNSEYLYSYTHSTDFTLYI